jgi:hypothetical protein
MKKLFFGAVGVVLALPSFAFAASAWPTSSVATISSALTATLPPSGRTFEPSDIAVTSSGVVLVSDEGDVAVMNDDGTGLSEWLIEANADLEGVAISGDTMYALHERNRDVYVYSLSSHERLATFDLSSWISGSDNLGPEGLAIDGSTLYVGHQATGVVYEFDISTGSPSLTTSWSTGLSLSALSFADDGKLYAMGSGVLRVYADDRSYVEYALPSQPQPEGVALRVNCEAGTASLFIANDTGPVYRFDNFPVSCPVTPTPEPTPEPSPEPEPVPEPVPAPEPVPVDADDDDVVAELDCNDADASVSTSQTYYRDADGDSLGSGTGSAAVCSASAPSGYVTNASDLNDAQAYFSARGTVNGSIIVTYGDGSSSTYQVYAMTTSTTISTVYQYKDSAYLVVVAPFGKRVAVVDPYTGAVIAMRSMPKSTSTLTSWLVNVIGY